MNTARLQHIREEEKKYHEECFENHRLYEKGTWLDEPIPLVMDLAGKLNLKRPLSVLDLGCGVGRNSIPLAKLIRSARGRMQCVDLLEMALNKLKQYSREHHVEHVINTQQADISYYKIPRNSFDYIVAASSLEHVKSEEMFKKALRRMAVGTKSGGINFIMMNTNIEEIEQNTGDKRETLIEVVMAKDKALATLQSNYKGWQEIHLLETPLNMEISRNDVPIILKADSLSYAVRKP